MKINFNQALAVLIAILSVLAVSTANLTDLFGETIAKTVSSAANLINAMIAGILAAYTGQAQMVKDVAAMPGIEPIKVNAEANATLAAVAMDPAVDKVSAVEHDAPIVAEIAGK